MYILGQGAEEFFGHLVQGISLTNGCPDDQYDSNFIHYLRLGILIVIASIGLLICCSVTAICGLMRLGFMPPRDPGVFLSSDEPAFIR